MPLELSFIVGFQYCILASPVTIWLAQLCASWLIFAFAPLIVWCAWRCAKHREAKRLIISAVVDAIIAFLVSVACGQFIRRVRPFHASTLVHLLVAVPGTQFSFPSSHSTIAFALATLLALHDRSRAVWWFAIAVGVAVGRVAVGVHYPTDVLTGMVIGVLTTLALEAITKKHWLKKSL